MFKKIIIVLSTILILFLLIGSINAADNNSTQLSDDGGLQSPESDYLIYEDSNSSYNPKLVATYVGGSSSSEQYTSGDISYQVKAYDILEYNGTKYNQPRYDSIIGLKVYSGTNFKYYNGTIGSDGTASFKLPDLSFGTHKIDIYVGGEFKKSASLNIVKSTTKVYAPEKTLKYAKNVYFNIKVEDSHGNIAKNVALKVKVYTGKKYVTYTVKTNSKGVAKLPTKKLSWGDHKLVIRSNDAKYSVSKSSKVYIRYYVPSEVNTLTAHADAKTVKYQNNDYFYIALKDEYNNPVKSVSMKVKVYTGSKYTTYTVKTNSSGVGKLNTNKLSVGTHQVVITSVNSNYKISKSSKIIVSKTVASSQTGPTKLSKLVFSQTPSGDYIATLFWISKKGTSYQILKKSDDNYKIIATVKATSELMSFKENVNGDELFTYSVREIIQKGSEKIIGAYDREGLKLMACPNVTVDFQNMKATIHWDKVNGATKYQIYRKVGNGGKYGVIASVDASKASYEDYYYNSPTELSSLLYRETFIDPSENTLSYTVRACNVKNVGGTEKVSYSLYLLDGDFHLEAPNIVSLQNNRLTWGKVSNAQGYLIVKKENSTGEWMPISQVNATTSTLQSVVLDSVDNDAYYSVVAYANKNGNLAFSLFDEDFSLTNSVKGSAYKVLYFGDSIFYGSPYNTYAARDIFSIPYRVSQLTGSVFYNPSISAATFAKLNQNVDASDSSYRYSIATDVVDKIYSGNLPTNWNSRGAGVNSEGISNTAIDYYDVVVLAAGANDFKRNVELGSINSSDVSTFYGALNHIMSKIEKASENRVSRGESPIKVVFADLHYGFHLYGFKQIVIRDLASNKIGLLFSTYRQALDNIYNKWQSSEYLTLSSFDIRDYDVITDENFPYSTVDNLHLTKFGYSQYGNVFADFLVENVF